MNQEEGIAASYDAAPDEWKMAAYAAISVLAEECEIFTTADIIEKVETFFPELEANYDALGGIMRSAVSKGMVSPINCDSCGVPRSIPSPRESQHRKLTLYRSNN